MGTKKQPIQLGEFGAAGACKEYTPPADPSVLKKLARWQDWKLGLLLTWGPYCQWGVTESWTLVTTRHPWNGRPPQFADLDDRTYAREYEKLARTFNPGAFDPDKWSAAAKEAGIQYVLPMSKHHDGFCMFDTATTDYRITDTRCPFSRNARADVLKAQCAAFRRQGLGVGLYFSKVDWHCPYYWKPELPPVGGQGANYRVCDDTGTWERFKAFTWRQIEELVTGYGPIDLLWLDGGAVRPPEQDIDMDGLAAMARAHQPGLIVVDRTVTGPNENYVTPEQQVPDHYLPYPWETCMTMGTAWSHRFSEQYKSAGVLLRTLCRIVARGGNYLLGAAPGPDGELDETVYVRFREMGSWLKVNGEAIYGTRPIAPYEQGNCVFTCKPDGTVYAIILSVGDGDAIPESVSLPADLVARAGRITLIGHGDAKPGKTHSGRTTIAIPAGARANPCCAHAWTLKLEQP